MLKKLLTVAVLGIATATSLVVGGCASDTPKGAYGLTGTTHPAPVRHLNYGAGKSGHA